MPRTVMLGTWQRFVPLGLWVFHLDEGGWLVQGSARRRLSGCTEWDSD